MRSLGLTDWPFWNLFSQTEDLELERAAWTSSNSLPRVLTFPLFSLFLFLPADWGNGLAVQLSPGQSSPIPIPCNGLKKLRDLTWPNFSKPVFGRFWVGVDTGRVRSKFEGTGPDLFGNEMGKKGR